MESLAFYDVEYANTTVLIDVGTVAPSSSDDTLLRVTNTSSLYQAEDVTVTVTGTDAVQLWLSLDGDTFTDSINVGDIAPGGGSGTFWLRRVTPSSAGSGSCTATLSAVPATWSNPIDTSGSGNIPLITED